MKSQFILLMVILALNPCVLLSFLKVCPICPPGMLLVCNVITLRLASSWMRSMTLRRGVVLLSEKTLVGISIGSYPGRRISWTLACTMTLSIRLVFCSQPDASISGSGILFGRSLNGLEQCVPIRTFLRSGNH